MTTQFWKFYKSIRESHEAVPDIKTINKDLKEVSRRLEASKTEDGEANDGLRLLAAECCSVALDLDKLLASLTTCGVNPSRTEAMKSAFKLIWKEQEILALKERLKGFREQLIFHLLATLRYV